LPEAAWVTYGGSFLVMPRGAPAPNKALAWELIRYLTLDRERQMAAFKSQDAFPALLAAHDDAFFEQPIPFLGQQPARLLWRVAAHKASAVRVHKQDGFAGEVIDTELDNVLDRGKDIATALADAERVLAKRARR
jgi:multiple sugar transport system substrate-binding protein